MAVGGEVVLGSRAALGQTFVNAVFPPSFSHKCRVNKQLGRQEGNGLESWLVENLYQPIRRIEVEIPVDIRQSATSQQNYSAQ